MAINHFLVISTDAHRSVMESTVCSIVGLLSNFIQVRIYSDWGYPRLKGWIECCNVVYVRIELIGLHLWWVILEEELLLVELFEYQQQHWVTINQPSPFTPPSSFSIPTSTA